MKFLHIARLLMTCCLSHLFCFMAYAAAPAETTTLHIVSTEFPPFIFYENGKPAGMLNEMLEVILARMHLKTEMEFLPWSRAYNTALTQANTLIFPVSKSPARENLFVWVGPAVTGSSYLYGLKKRTDIEVTTLADAKKYSVGTIRNGIRTEILREQGFTRIEENSTASGNAQKLILGWIDLWAEEESTTYYCLKQLGYLPEETVRAVFPIDIKSEGYFAFNKDSDSQLVESFRSAFNELRQSDQYQQILQRYRFHQ